MTIREAIDRVDLVKPNRQNDQQKIAWLSDLDRLVYNELVLTHEGCHKPFDGYDLETPQDTVLLVPAPYTDIYLYYLSSQIDLANAELAKYNNDKTMFNNAYLTYSDYYTKKNMPLQRCKGFRL